MGECMHSSCCGRGGLSSCHLVSLAPPSLESARGFKSDRKTLSFLKPGGGTLHGNLCCRGFGMSCALPCIMGPQKIYNILFSRNITRNECVLDERVETLVAASRSMKLTGTTCTTVMDCGGQRLTRQDSLNKTEASLNQRWNMTLRTSVRLNVLNVQKINRTTYRTSADPGVGL